MVYMHKYSEAIACLADVAPAAEKYPLLNASIGIDGDTLSEVANNIRGVADVWISIAAQIEKVRLSGKRGVMQAAKTVDAVAAFRSVDWGGVGMGLGKNVSPA